MTNYQLYLPRLLHGKTNMQSGIIPLYERGWPLARIENEFRVSTQTILDILTRFGYQDSPLKVRGARRALSAMSTHQGEL